MMPLSSRAYDVLKWVAQILIPGIGTLYFGLAQIWGLPNAEQVVGTLTAVDVFLGLILGLSAKSFNANEKYDGTMVVNESISEEQPSVFSLELDKHPGVLAEKEELRLRVQKPPTL